MVSRLRRLYRQLQSLLDFFPLTGMGLFVALLSVWVWKSFSTTSLDFVLHSAAIGALLLVALSALIAAVAAVVLKLRLREIESGPDLVLESGIRTATGFSYPDTTTWPLVYVRLEWVDPGSVDVDVQVGAGQRRELVTPKLRGRFTHIKRRFVISDIFGFVHFIVRKEIVQHVVIKPGATQSAIQTIVHTAGGDAISHPGSPPEGEMLDMRRYVHGDPLRWIIWKIYGRTRQLVVRTAEQAVMPSPSMTAYFVAGPGDEASASIARLYLENGMLGRDFLFCADGATKPTSVTQEALEQVIQSVDHRHEGGAGLASFLERIERERRAAFLLFLPAQQGPWLQHVASVMRSMPNAVSILAYDAETFLQSPSRLSSLLFEIPRSNKRELAHLGRVVRTVSSAGLRLNIIHRPTGQMITPQQLLESLS